MTDYYKLHYYNTTGSAEPIRMIFSYVEADWEDLRFSLSSGIPDAVKAISPYGQVPVLEFNGHIIAQSQTITRFVARKFNLVGANEQEAAKCDEIVDAVRDLVTLWRSAVLEKDEAKRLEIVTKAMEDSKTRFLPRFNEILEANGNCGHFVGKGLTWADITAAHYLDSIEQKGRVKLIHKFPAVEKLVQTVFNEPRIKRWIKERPEVQ